MLALAVGAPQALCQSFVYVDPGIAVCPEAPAATTAKTVQRGARLAGRIKVSCGFEQGSYTVSLTSTDPGANFTPKTFIVNFGRIVGNGAFTVAFSTLGVHRVSAEITSNMGSPPVQGRFVSAASEFNVVAP